MSKISTYPEIGNPTLGDLLIGTDVSNDNATKNFTISSILALGGGTPGGPYVPYTGANSNVNLGTYTLGASKVYTNEMIPQSNNILYLGGQDNGFGVCIDLALSFVAIGDYFGNRGGNFLAIDDSYPFIASFFDNVLNGIGITPNEITLGDFVGAYKQIQCIIDNANGFIYTKKGEDYKGYFLNLEDNQYYFGDIGQGNNGTTLVILDEQKTISTGLGKINDDLFISAGIFIDLSLGGSFVSIGDFVGSLGNNTFITLNDAEEKLVFSDNCALEVSNGVGTTGQVLVSQGATATPIWSDVVAKLTTVQRDAIVSPAAGLIVYDTTVNKVSVFNGTIWKYLAYE